MAARLTKGLQGFSHPAAGHRLQWDIRHAADLRPMLPDARERLDAAGSPLDSGNVGTGTGLWFCGYKVVPTGHLREIRLEADAIAREIAAS